MKRVIYKLTNKITNKIYIGQTNNVRLRLNEHKNRRSHCTYISKAIKKYGWENFNFEIVTECDDSTVDRLEIYYIYFYDCLAPKGYNLQKGGQGGKTCHPDTKIKLRDKHLGKKLSEEHKEKLRQAHLGKSLSEDHKRKIGEHFKTMPRTKEHCENISKALTGKKFSSERAQKNREVSKERIGKFHHTPETRAKIAAAGRGRKMSLETILKRKVQEKETNLISYIKIWGGKMKQEVKRDIWLFSGCGAGVGKDTAAGYMAEILKFKNFSPVILSFANRLKIMASEKFGFDFERMATDRDYKNQCRPYLISLGNDMRYLDPFFWVDLCEKDFIEKTKYDERAIGLVVDARYLNEIDHFLLRTKYQYNKVRTIYIQVNDETILERFGPESFQKYILGKRDRSEREMKHCKRDYLISNDKSKEYLKNAIEAIIKEEY